VAIVTGIFPSSDPAALETALGTIDKNKLKIVTKGVAASKAENSVLDFVIVAKAQETNDFSDDITHGTNVIDSSGGTGVPGLSGRMDLSSFSSSSAANYLTGSGIPADVAGNYNDAIEEGRAVAIYDASAGDGDAIAAALRDAGFKNVRTY